MRSGRAGGVGGSAAGHDDGGWLAYYRWAVVDVGVLAPRDLFAEPAIVVSFSGGDNSGRQVGAETIGRGFPAYRAYAERVLEIIEQAVPAGPYPGDILTYKSKVPRNGEAIRGFAFLFGQPPSLLKLSIRLARGTEGLAPAILAQAEREALRQSSSQTKVRGRSCRSPSCTRRIDLEHVCVIAGTGFGQGDGQTFHGAGPDQIGIRSQQSDSGNFSVIVRRIRSE